MESNLVTRKSKKSVIAIVLMVMCMLVTSVLSAQFQVAQIAEAEQNQLTISKQIAEDQEKFAKSVGGTAINDMSDVDELSKDDTVESDRIEETPIVDEPLDEPIVDEPVEDTYVEEADAEAPALSADDNSSSNDGLSTTASSGNDGVMTVGASLVVYTATDFQLAWNDSVVSAITLGTNITLTSSNGLYACNRTLTLDLNGYILDLGPQYLYILYDTAYFTLRSNDTSRINSLYCFGTNTGGSTTKSYKTIYGGILTGSNNYAVYVVSGATFNLTSGTIAGIDGGTYWSAVRVVSSTFNMTGGAVSYNYTKGLSGDSYNYPGGVCITGTSSVFNMSNGSISYNGAGASGGGVGVEGSCTFNFTGGFITHNTAFLSGGGTIANGGGVAILGGTFKMSGGTISYNSARWGGGLYCTPTTYNDTVSVSILGGDIHNNSATAHGGGIFFHYGSLTLSNVNIISNTAGERGGGIYISSKSTLSLNSGSISTNKAAYGGGIAVISSTTSFTMYGGYILNNSATATVFHNAGGLYVDTGATAKMLGGEISGNYCYGGCGGVYAYASNAKFEMSGGTISGNKTSNTSMSYDYQVGVFDGTFVINSSSATISANSGSYGLIVNGSSSTVTLANGTIGGLTQLYYGRLTWSGAKCDVILSPGQSNVTCVANITPGSGSSLDLSAGILNLSGYYVKINSGVSFTLKDSIPYYTNSVSCYNKSSTASTQKISGGVLTGTGTYAIYNAGTFTMSGGTIAGIKTNYPVYNTSTFKMTGGGIQYNYRTGNGGGVYNAGGTFTMSDGTINNNTAAYGGGVYVAGGTFTMSGGTISNNTATSSGGGIYVGSITATISGGTISGNTASTYGGGVYVSANATFTLSSAPKITSNYKGSSTTQNVYLPSGALIKGTLTSSASVGITSASTGIFTSGYGKTVCYGYISDVSTKCISVSGTELKIGTHSLTAWSYNSTQHWQSCASCGQTSGSASNHSITYSGSTTHSGKCNTCGYVASTHTPTASSFTSYDSTYHYGTCSYSGCNLTVSKTHSLASSYTASGTTHYRKCSSCSYQISHTAITSNYIYSNATYHVSTCTYSGCGLTTSATHSWNSYASDGSTHTATCSVCKGTKSHSQSTYYPSSSSFADYSSTQHRAYCTYSDCYVYIYADHTFNGAFSGGTYVGATHSRTCTASGCSRTQTHSGTASSWGQYSDSQHSSTCSNSSCSITLYQDHTGSFAGTTTHSRTCTTCGRVQSHSPVTPTTWLGSSNATQHYGLCGNSQCSVTMYGNHTYSNNNWKLVSGLHSNACSAGCGYAKTHGTTSYPTRWSRYDDNYHYGICAAGDGCSIEVSQAHSGYTWKNDSSNHWEECASCASTKNRAAHSYSSYVNDGDSGHHQVCSNTNCGYKSTTVAHTYSNSNWKLVNGQHSNACSANGCEYAKTHEIKFPSTWTGTNSFDQHTGTCAAGDGCTVVVTQAHAWAWESNSTNHWQRCTICNSKQNEAAHVYNSYVSDGEKGHHQVCVNAGCGYKNATTAHVYEGPYTFVDGLHSKTCSANGCDYAKAHGTNNFPTNNWTGSNDNQHTGTCAFGDGCTLTVGQDHSWKWNTSEANTHWEYCSVCNKIRNTGSHDFTKYLSDGENGHYRVCSSCQFKSTYSEHYYDGTYVLSEGKHANLCSANCGYAITHETNNYPETWTGINDNDQHTGTCAYVGCSLEVQQDHTWKWEQDDNSHWQRCAICNNKQNDAKHVYDGYINANANGHYQQCTNTNCNYKSANVVHYYNTGYALVNGQHSKTCSASGCEYTLTHATNIYPNEWYSKTNDYTNHYGTCAYAGTGDSCTVEVTNAHIWAWDHNTGSHWEVCSGCNMKQNDEKHVYNGYIQYGNAGHYQQCTNTNCNYKTDTVVHYYNTGYALIDGMHSKTCSANGCGYALKHAINIYPSTWSSKMDDDYHYGTCAYKTEGDSCMLTVSQTHAWTWEHNTVNHWERCASCSLKRNEEAHVYGNVYYNDGDEGHHQVCTNANCKNVSDTVSHYYNVAYTLVGGMHTTMCSAGSCGFTKSHGTTNYPSVWTGVNNSDQHTGTCAYGDSCKVIVEQSHAWAWVTTDYANHWQECAICHTKKDVNSHTYNGFISDGEKGHHQKCTFANCGYETPIIGHSDLLYDATQENQHWQYCPAENCTYTTNLAPHGYGSWREEGEQHLRNCLACDRLNQHTINVTSWANKSDNSAHTGYCNTTDDCKTLVTRKHQTTGNWASDNTYHWNTCGANGCLYESTHILHPESEMTAWKTNGDDQHISSCAVCGNDKIVGNHDKYWAKQNDNTYHWQVCSMCDYESAKSQHDNIDWTPTDAKTHTGHCNTCDQSGITGNHDYIDKDTLAMYWVSNDDVHYQHCFSCNYNSQATNHDKVTWNPSQTDGENHHGQCSTCFNTDVKQPHDLYYVTSDESVHWKECRESGCVYTTTKLSHEFEYKQVVNSDGTSDAHKLSCPICGVDNILRSHNVLGTWEQADGYHFHACEYHCGYVEDKDLHDLIPGECYPVADNPSLHAGYCEGCNMRNAEEPHDFTPGSYGHNEEKHWAKCQKCIAANGRSAEEYHNWGSSLYIVTEEGQQHYQKCIECNYETPKRYHNETMVQIGEYKEATCREDDGEGRRAYYQCTVCQFYFANNNATVLIGNKEKLNKWLDTVADNMVDGGKIAKLPHNFVNDICSNPDCGEFSDDLKKRLDEALGKLSIDGNSVNGGEIGYVVNNDIVDDATIKFTLDDANTNKEEFESSFIPKYHELL